jgi:hypothetical protein
MRCIKKSSFTILINGAASLFFHVGCGIKQGCPLSHLIFLLVVEGLSRAIADAKRRGYFQGITISPTLRITHLLFVNYVLLFCSGSRRDADSLNNIMGLFFPNDGNVDK